MTGFIKLSEGVPLAWGTASKTTFNAGKARFDAKGILINTFIANAPQVLLSLAYFLVNNVITGLSSAPEWNSFAMKRKPLRVTSRRGCQRSTHFLQLPYRWAIPLITYSGLLHWLLSQGLFIVRVEIRDRNGNFKNDESICACGYSIASLLALSLATIAGLAFVGILVFRRRQEMIPHGANSSLILSAACHPPPNDIDAHLKRVKWGVVKNRFNESAIVHCSLTSEDVVAPKMGQHAA